MGKKEILQQTGVWYDWQFFSSDTDLFWECVDPIYNSRDCNGANNWLSGPLISNGDLITMYTSGNYHWEEDNRLGAVNAGNYGSQPLLDSAEWIVERPDVGGSQVTLSNFGHQSFVRMEWMDQYNNWNDPTGDSDMLRYNLMNNLNPGNYALASGGMPWWDGTYWGYAIDLYWLHGQ